MDTTLLTNAPDEPRVGRQLVAEIESADRIDVVMAFIRMSGIRQLLEAVRRFCSDGRAIRVLTTTYTGSTEANALEALRDAGAEVCISYDTSSTRLHAKAWLFHRRSGFSTAYIGSSNLTHSAQVTGLEWNLRVSQARNATVIEKVAAVFDSYWEGGDFVPYEAHEFARQVQGAGRGSIGPTLLLSPVEVRLAPFQERLLEQVALARERGRHRNLLVSATGTGKTVMAAVDYQRLRSRGPDDRLLFVAHRAEILEQSLLTYRQVLRNASFGELWVGHNRPEYFDHVFASVQSLTARGVGGIDPDHFDVVVVDEFHHAAAPTYEAILEHLRPKELLGLTATPERSDDLDVLRWFEGRIAAELRLWEAIDQHRLVPFMYYGIADTSDLREVPWRRGRGYDAEGLTRLYTANDHWVHVVFREVLKHVDDAGAMRALGFCVSIDHARFMARKFTESGIPATAVWGDSAHGDREQALANLRAGKVNVVFSVDLFNEGVDLPTVDTLLLLRPTDSPTLFLQQLGRGLRLAPDKDFCTVLDFVGQHRKEFRFDRRFRALLGGTRAELIDRVEQGFPYLPAGCHMELDAVARDVVLRSIRSSIPDRWGEKVEELRRLRRTGRAIRLATYLEESGLELDDVYRGNRGWSDLCEAAGVGVAPSGPAEAVLRRATGRLLHVDDQVRIQSWREVLDHLSGSTAPGSLLERSDDQAQRLVRMLVGSLFSSRDAGLPKEASLEDGLNVLARHPQVITELTQLLEVLDPLIDHLQVPLGAMPGVPLRVHARYTRVEILAALGEESGARVAPFQTGVYWPKDGRSGILAFTLDKTSGAFSPTTRYRDYAVSRSLIHWESQGITRAASKTGRRYQEHDSMRISMLLFARLRQDQNAFWFLGPAHYVRHEGERPMAVTWRLETPLPGDLFAAFAAAVA